MRTDVPPTLTMICGLPGTGKTTLAKRMETQERAVRLNPDEWMTSLGVGLWNEEFRDRTERLQGNFAERLLELGINVIIEWGTWAREERLALVRIARSKEARVELHLLAAPPPVELWQRIRARNQEDPPVELVHVERWLAAFETPDAHEFEAYDEVTVHTECRR